MPLHRTTRPLLRALTWILLRLLPPRHHIVVHGWPDSEGNALHVLRVLTRRYDGKIVWLLNDIDYPPPRHLAEDLARVTRMRKDSVGGWWTSLGAEATFFTHGLYTAVRPPANRLAVNLWHGDGPKRAQDTHLVRSTVVVAGTQQWGGLRARLFELPADAVAIVGNPRIDDFEVPVEDQALTRLGLDPHRPFVLWLPTYRNATAPRRAWSDADRLNGAELGLLDAAVENAREHLGLDVVLKPHPLDAHSFEGMGVPVVTNEDLERAGVTLYQVLGASRAVISDVSSVWTDYLALDRPIAFYAPDLEELEARRGFNVEDLETMLPGMRVTDMASLQQFFEGVGRADPTLRPSAYPGMARIGPAPRGAVADRLLDWLDHYQVGRRRRPLFDADVGSPQRPAGASSHG